jgi:hypothetical protein
MVRIVRACHPYSPRREDTTAATAALPPVIYLYLVLIIASWAGNWPASPEPMNQSKPVFIGSGPGPVGSVPE